MATAMAARSWSRSLSMLSMLSLLLLLLLGTSCAAVAVAEDRGADIETGAATSIAMPSASSLQPLAPPHVDLLSLARLAFAQLDLVHTFAETADVTATAASTIQPTDESIMDDLSVLVERRCAPRARPRPHVEPTSTGMPRSHSSAGVGLWSTPADGRARGHSPDADRAVRAQRRLCEIIQQRMEWQTNSTMGAAASAAAHSAEHAQSAQSHDGMEDGLSSPDGLSLVCPPFATLNASDASTNPECLSLYEFWSGLEAVSQTLALPGWGTATPVCEWRGIQCDDSNNTVVGIDLSGGSDQLSLFGKPPTLFRGLANLTTLSLADNCLFGDVSIWLHRDNLPGANSGGLRELKLNGNCLSVGISLVGTVPSDLHESTPLLEHLDLSYLWLVQLDTAQLPRWTQLVHISIGNSAAIGDLTCLDAAPPLARLVYLHAPECPLMTSAPLPALKEFESLKEIELTNTPLSGELPAEWQSLPSLDIVRLGNCGLGGDLHEWSHPQVTWLGLGGNQFNGQHPTSAHPHGAAGWTQASSKCCCRI